MGNVRFPFPNSSLSQTVRKMGEHSSSQPAGGGVGDLVVERHLGKGNSDRIVGRKGPSCSTGVPRE